MKKGYKQTEVGVIPEEWEVATVATAFEIANQFRMPLSHGVREQMVGPYPYYGPTGIQGYINEYRVDGEYALVGEDGDHFLKWRYQAMTLLVSGQFNVNNHAHLIRGGANEIRWFFHYFAHKDLTPFLTRQGAARYKLTKATLLDIPCALPPLPEQRAIAAALGDVDALITGLEELVAKKRDLKRATMQQLLTGKQRLPGFRGEWEVRRMEEVVILRKEKIDPLRSGSPNFCIELEHIGQGTGRLTGHDTTSGSVSIKSKFQQGDVLFGKLRSYLRKYWLADCAGVCSTEIWVLMAKSHCLQSEFLFHIVSCDEFIETASTAYGTHMPRADWHVVKSYDFALPPLPEQTAIAAILSDMDAEIEALEKRLEKTRALKQGMMQELLTGKTRLV